MNTRLVLKILKYVSEKNISGAIKAIHFGINCDLDKYNNINMHYNEHKHALLFKVIFITRFNLESYCVYELKINKINEKLIYFVVTI